MAEMSTIKKYITIIEEFNARLDNTLSAYDEVLLKELSVGTKQIGRLLEELSEQFDNIILLDGKKKKTYKLLKPIDLFVEAFDKSNDIGWFFNLAHDGDPQVFKGLEKFINPKKHIYKFKNSPFEDVSTLESKQAFKRLKTAVENSEYRDIKFYHDENVYKNLKCLRLVFMDNNWYIAFVDSEGKLRFGRISFIEEVGYSTGKTSFQQASMQKQKEFLETDVQNSMTLFNHEVKIAVVKAHPNIARYFEKDMKKFLSTQKFDKKLDDGSVIFTLNYTQELEILPLIQRWLPDLEILKPSSLKDIYKRKLSKALKRY